MKAQESRHVINVNEYLRLLVDSSDFKSASLKDKEVCGDLCDDAKEHGGLFSSNINTRVPSVSALWTLVSSVKFIVSVLDSYTIVYT